MNLEPINPKRVCKSCKSFFPEGCPICLEYVNNIFIQNGKQETIEHLRDLILFSYHDIHNLTEDEINDVCITSDIKFKISKHLKYLEDNGCFRESDYDKDEQI